MSPTRPPPPPDLPARLRDDAWWLLPPLPGRPALRLVPPPAQRPSATIIPFPKRESSR